MTKLCYSQILLAMPFLILGTGTAHAASLTAASTTVNLTYQLPATAGSAVNVAFTATAAGTFFYVESNTVPNWLTVTQNGTAGTTAVTTTGAADLISFQANAVASILAPGTYSASVIFQSSATGNPTATVTVNLLVKSVASTFTVSASSTSGTITGGGTTTQTAALAWSQGTTAYPTLLVGGTSSGDPINYSITLGGTIASSLSVDHAGGVAYSWGSASSTVSIASLTLLKANVGSTLTGTVTVTPVIGGVNGTPTVITVTIAVNPAAVTITGLSPIQLPVATTGNATVVMSGSGFVTGTTVIKVSTDGTVFTALATNQVNVVNPNTIVLTVPSSYTSTAQTLTFSAQDTGITVTPVTTTLTVTANPIIYSITNSGSYVPPVSGSNAAVAAYELISIFGANFDSTGTTPINNTLNSLGMYPTTLNNTAGNAVSVSFISGSVAGASTTDLGDAPLLFVSNNQINAIVPAGVAAQLGSGGATATAGANVVVTVASVGSNDTAVNPYNVDIVASVPGVFTGAGSGQGAAAVLNADWSLNTLANPAVHGTGVHIYATGLGAPSSTAHNDGTVSSLTYPGSCIAPAEYLKVLNGVTAPPTTPLGSTAGTALASGTLTAIDGAVLETADIYANVYAPCFPVSSSTGIQAKFGTSSTAVAPTYAGFVMGSVAGLYQVDVTLPASFTPAAPSAGGPVALYITDGIGPSVVTSQTGVTIYVK